MMKNHLIIYKDNEKGFSLIEVIIAMAILSICLIPILSMIFSSATNRISAKRYYEATIMAQNLDEEVKKEIGRKLVKDEKLGTMGTPSDLTSFLEEYDDTSFNNHFKGAKDYNYEVYIQEMDGSKEKYDLFADTSKLYSFIHWYNESPATIDVPREEEAALATSDIQYFSTSDFFASSMEALDFGYIGGSWSSDTFTTHITLNRSSDPRYDIIVTNNPSLPTPLTTSDVITLNLDAAKVDPAILTTNLVVRVENSTKANVFLSIYRLSTALDEKIEVFPIQNNVSDLGNIFVQRKTMVVPKENYVIRIIVRDKKTGKILKQMVDIYAHDYRLATY